MSLITLPVDEAFVAGDELPAADVKSMAQVINAVLPVGILLDFFGLESQVPDGMLACSGKTVGDASSNATARANADMSALFAHLWEIGNTDGSLSILTSGGSGSTYGANAAADFAAHKQIALPDCRGRVTAGKDTMGGVDAGLITTNDAQGDKVGGIAGEEDHTLTIPEMPAHTHGIQGSKYDQSFASGFPYGGTGTGTLSGSTGGGGAHNNLQPTMFVTKIIFTGATW